MREYLRDQLKMKPNEYQSAKFSIFRFWGLFERLQLSSLLKLSVSPENLVTRGCEYKPHGKDEGGR